VVRGSTSSALACPLTVIVVRKARPPQIDVGRTVDGSSNACLV